MYSLDINFLNDRTERPTEAGLAKGRGEAATGDPRAYILGGIYRSSPADPSRRMPGYFSKIKTASLSKSRQNSAVSSWRSRLSSAKSQP